MVFPPKALIAVLFLLVNPILQPEEWARFRGPNGNGKGTLDHLNNKITVADYVWAQRLIGDGHSSPVLWDGKIFLTQTDPEGKQRKVICFNQTNGAILWQWQDRVISHHKHRHNNFASTTPVVNTDRVFVVWTTADKTEALALSHSGDLIWRKSWTNFSSDHGHAASPILVNNVLVFHTDAKDLKQSYLYGLNADDGEVIWKIERNTPKDQPKHLSAYNTPTVIDSEDGPLILALQSNDGWIAVSPSDGAVKWSYPGGYKNRSVASVLVENNIAFATFGSGGAGKHGVALKLENNKATELYTLGIKDGLPYVPTPIIHNGLIFLWADSGILTCRKLANGEEVYRERIGGNYYCSPILIGDRLLNISRSGEMVITSASKDFKLLGRSQLENDGKVHATPAITKDGLIVRTDTHLIYIKAIK